MPQRLGAFPRINLGHFAAPSLLACVVPEGELLTGTPPTIVDSHGILAPGEWGPGIKSDQGGGANTGGVKFTLPASAPLYSIGNTWSAVLVARISTIGSNFRAMVAVPYQANGDNPYYGFSSHNCYGDTAQGLWITLSGSITYYNSLSGWFLQDGNVHVYVVTCANGSLVFYRDGVVYATDTMTGGTPDIATNKQPLWVGCATPVTLGQLAVDQTVFLYTVHNRILSAAEVLLYTSDPFAILVEDDWAPLIADFAGAGGPASYTASLSDSVAPSGALGRALVAARALADSIAPSDASSRSYAPRRSLADSVGPTDALTRALVASRGLSDSVSPSDAVARATLLARAIADGITAPSDALARAVQFARAQADSVAPSDTITRQAVLARATGDSVNPSDSAARLLVAARALADAVTAPSDAVGYSLTGHNARSISDAIGAPTDSLGRTLVAARAIADAVAPSDAVARSVGRSRSLADSITAPSDSLARAPAYARALADAVGLPSDALARHLTAARAQADAVGAPADSLARLEAFARALADSVGAPSDAVAASLAGGRTRLLSDSVSTPSDSLARALVAARGLADGINAPTDQVLAGFVVILLAIAFAVESPLGISIEVQQTIDIDLEVKPT